MLSAALALCLGLWFAAGADFCLDDAYIHLDYALSLKLGQGLSYNPHDWETGSSSPAWTVLLALWPWFDHPIVSVKLLGVLLHAVTAWLAAELAIAVEALAPSPPRFSLAALSAGLLVAAAPSLLQSATSGMEPGLTALLLLLALWCEMRGWTRSLVLISALATLARPESLFFALAFGAMRLASERKLRALAMPLGALCGLGVWMLHCYAVSGFVWPNTQYVKGRSWWFASLPYVGANVLPAQPWLLGGGGLVLLGMALMQRNTNQRRVLLTMLGAWLFTLVATAISRPCPLQVLFYVSRYFAIVAPVPHVCLALAVRSGRRMAWLAPVAAVNVWLIFQTLDIERAQENDIQQLHTKPALTLAKTLPASAVIAVEGAGAARFYTPRTMRIIDVAGLNTGAIAHLRDDQQRLCHILSLRPTHLALPDSLLSLTVPLQVTPLGSFHDPDYRIVRGHVSRTVYLFSTSGLKPKWQGLCKSPPAR